MSTHTKSKLFLLIIGILLVTNIAMVFFMLKDKDRGRRPSRDRGAAAKEFLQKEIGFNPQQLQQFDTLSKQQGERMKASYDEMRKNKELQFKELGRRGFSDSAIADAITQSAEKQKMMELQFYNHMLDIRKLCTPEQLPKFDSLFYKMWNRKDKKPEEKK